MPFDSKAYVFDKPTHIDHANEVGAVYGLAEWRPLINKYVILYVGLTDNLRRRLNEHYCNPPAVGITHWFAEAIANAAQRAQREAELIREFNPRGNTIGTW